MISPLITTHSKLLSHFQQTGSILAAAVDTSVQPQIEIEFVHPRAISGLSGSGCEFISRNRGGSTPVAPFLHLRDGLWVWLGYHEEWDEQRRVGNVRRYSFRSVGLSVHFGIKNNIFKPQMFRAEWAGWANWEGSNYGFQAPDAGHPHWQFDALDSLPDETLSQRASQILSRLKNHGQPEVRDFIPHLTEVDVRDMVTVQKLSRVHFASAAAWWKSSPQNTHVHGPNDIKDVQNWVRHSLDYIKLELNRL